jgi:hypothetical protein
VPFGIVSLGQVSCSKPSTRCRLNLAARQECQRRSVELPAPLVGVCPNNGGMGPGRQSPRRVVARSAWYPLAIEMSEGSRIMVRVEPGAMPPEECS